MRRFLPVILLLPLPISASNALWSGFDPDCQSCLDLVFNWCVDATDTDTEFAECICNGDGVDGTQQCKTICNSNDLIWGTSGSSIDTTWIPYCMTELECSNVERLLAPDSYQELCTGENPGSG
ncbi:hypothetical protein DL764_002578 [Monosporascus ibericus]|uniref:Extracellular membrane protein CFEM domain-containing protein n=1 Tax=Monosporascus ibericus TaxID=155417 RepID=A0A4Q4TJT9_9PEZI|nr:hypothetical protein DL764_002578 [Monosporascus ibericus]